MKTTHHLIPQVALGLALALAPAALTAQTQYTSDFDIERCTFAADGRQNAYFSLNPGDQLTLEGEEDGTAIRDLITVTNNTKAITFATPHGITMTVTARVVVEREWQDGELVELSRNWFARCRQTNDVFYFGEAVDIYEDGQVVNHNGSWQAGVNGAQPGIMVPARFLLGSRYFQERAPGVALDRARHLEMGLRVTAAGRTFDNCGKVAESSALDASASDIKVYCPGVGLVMDNTLLLTDFRRP
jgi:hypothetical protein